MSAFVWGLCGDEAHAQRAVTGLVEGSFPPEEITVRARDERGEVEPVRVRHQTAAPVGAAIGAVVGAGAAALAVAGAAGGPGEATFGLGIVEVTAAGAVTGAGLGAYGGLYFWRQRIAVPGEPPAGSRVLVGVTVPIERASAAADILRRAQATEVHTSHIDHSGRPVPGVSGPAADLVRPPVREPG